MQDADLTPLFNLRKEVCDQFVKDVEDYLSDHRFRFRYIGLQPCSDLPLKDFILFRAPRTGSTLAVPLGVLQMAKLDAIALVRARIAQNEEDFLRGTSDYRDD